MTSEKVEPQKEKVEVASNGDATPASEEIKPASDKTRTEEEFLKAVEAATSKAQSSLNKEANQAKAEVERLDNLAKGYADQIARLEREQDDYALSKFADDPEALTAFKDRKEITKGKIVLVEEQRKFAEKQGKIEELALNSILARTATELSKEHGISIKELEECATPEQMEVKAIKFALANVKEKTAKEPEGETSKFASNISNTGGGGAKVYKIGELKALQEEISKLPLGERRKARQDISDAFKKGRVTE